MILLQMEENKEEKHKMERKEKMGMKRERERKIFVSAQKFSARNNKKDKRKHSNSRRSMLEGTSERIGAF